LLLWCLLAGSLVYAGYPNSPDTTTSSSSSSGPTAFVINGSSGTAAVEVAAVAAPGNGCAGTAAGEMQAGNGMSSDMSDAGGAEELPLRATDRDSLAAAWTRLRPRYFTPAEIARLHSFPASFCFPGDMEPRQCYKLLGNSLSVAVVADLLKFLLLSGSGSSAAQQPAASAGGAL
jgi:hypothetical protein